MRIRFLEPRPPGAHVYDNALLPRLGLPLMARMLAEAGHDVYCYVEALAPVDVEDCLGADLVGISSTTSTQPYAYAIADELRSAGVPVVFGGPHVSFLADEALEHADFVVRGEGERTIMELVDAVEREQPLDGIAGLSWRDTSGRVLHNAARPNCTQAEFEALPAPDLSLIKGHERMGIKPIMTQWGCTFDCEFCSVTAMFSRRVRHRRTDQILNELQGLNAETVFFHDDCFVVNKTRTRDLLRTMIDTDTTPEWMAQVRAAETVFASKSKREPDFELLELMQASNCFMVMVGFESVSDESLGQMNKKQHVADIVESVDLFHRHGIKVHGMFIAGADTDDVEAADRITAFARHHGIDTIQIMIEMPLPGTHLYRRITADGRLLSSDWSLYDGHHAVMAPARSSAADLQLAVVGAMERFYSLPGIVGPAVKGALKGLPQIVRSALRPHSIPALPRFTLLTLRRRWQEALDLMRDRLPIEDIRRLRESFAVPMLRSYGRAQLAKFNGQPRTLAHLEHLRALPA